MTRTHHLYRNYRSKTWWWWWGDDGVEVGWGVERWDVLVVVVVVAVVVVVVVENGRERKYQALLYGYKWNSVKPR